MRFGSPFGSLLAPFGCLWAPFGSLWAPFGSLLAPFWLHFGPCGHPLGHLAPFEHHFNSPGSPLAPFPLHFGHRGSIWHPLGTVLAPLGSLLAPFGSLLAPFGSLLATLWLLWAPFWRALARFATLGSIFSLLMPPGFLFAHKLIKNLLLRQLAMKLRFNQPIRKKFEARRTSRTCAAGCRASDVDPPPLALRRVRRRAETTSRTSASDF